MGGIAYVVAHFVLLIGGVLITLLKHLGAQDRAIYVAVASGGIALLLLAYSLIRCAMRVRVLTHAVQAEAVVTRVQAHGGSDDPNNYPTEHTLHLEVQYPEGQRSVVTYDAGVLGGGVKPGDKLDVIYDSRLPGQVEIPMYMPGQPVFDTHGFVIRPTSPASVWGFAAVGVVMFAAWLVVLLW